MAALSLGELLEAVGQWVHQEMARTPVGGSVNGAVEGMTQSEVTPELP